MVPRFSSRTAARVGAVGGALAVVLVPTAAFALDPLPTPSLLAPVTGLLSPSPSPSPSSSPLAPVASALPTPVTQVLSTATAQATAPATAPQPAPAAVQPNSRTAPQQVAAPRTGTAAAPALRGSTFASGLSTSGLSTSGLSTSGLPPLALGTSPTQLDQLFSVPDVAAPLALTPQAAAPAHRGRVPAGLPVLAVALAAITLGGAAVGHLAALRGRRSSGPA